MDEDVDYFMAAGTSYALLGDPRGLEAARTLEALAQSNRLYSTIAARIAAVGHTRMGNEAAARRDLDRAEFLRDELYAGRRDQWAGGAIDLAFDNLAPIARGR